MMRMRETTLQAVILLAYALGMVTAPYAYGAPDDADVDVDSSALDVDVKAAPGIDRKIDLGKTEPGPVVCGQIEPACAEENAKRVEALNKCQYEASSCRLDCDSQECDPPPTGLEAEPGYQEALSTYQTCVAGKTDCENRCDFRCAGLPRPRTCDTIPIAATCSSCNALEYVKTCEVHGWLPFQPPVLHVVSTCDTDWSGIGTCSPCHKQLSVGPKAGQRTCQCRYPSPQPPGPAWRNICHIESTVDKPVRESAPGH